MASILSNKLDDFREVVLLDTEFVGVDGNPVVPVALVAHEMRSGRCHRVFFGEEVAAEDNPLPQGNDVLYVAYAAQAEWSVFLALGWDLPANVLDLFAEFRCLTNGCTTVDGRPLESSLIAALRHFGLDAMSHIEKEAMRLLILRGHPYSCEEQEQILHYCGTDVDALARLLPAMSGHIDLPFALFRGRYTGAVARMEASGVPIDLPYFGQLKSQWSQLKADLVSAVESENSFGVYEGVNWSNSRFEDLLRREGILSEWPLTTTGLLCHDDDTFRTMAARFPQLVPLREVRSTLTHLRELKLTVGQDGRNRFSVAPFRSVTGRNYPASSKFIFGPSTWLRSLIKPEINRAVAYIDWTSAEFGIAAALSEDARMIAAYETGDVYMAFAIEAGAAPAGATKDTHAEIRELYKLVTLAVQYGQGASGLARTLGKQEWEAKVLLDLHRRVYQRYWQWSEWTTQKAAFSRSLETVFRWPMHVTPRTKPTTVSNFPMQAHGAEMLRWACVFATEQGVEVHAPVQDALLIGAETGEIEDAVARARAAMDMASELVLDGFVLRSDVKVVKYPERYSDKRGVHMWNQVAKLMGSGEFVS